MNKDLRESLKWQIGLVADEFIEQKFRLDRVWDKRRSANLVKRHAEICLRKVARILKTEKVRFDRINLQPSVGEHGVLTVKRGGQKILEVTLRSDLVLV